MQHLISSLPTLAIIFTNIACLCYLLSKHFKSNNYLAVIFSLTLLLIFFPFSIINNNSFLPYCLYLLFLYVFAFYSRIGPLIALIWYPLLSSAILSPIAWTKLYFQAIQTDNIFLHKVLDTATPNFQDNLKLVVGIILFFLFVRLIKNLRSSWKIFNLFSLFLVLLFSSYYPFFVIVLAYYAAFSLASNNQTSFYLKYQKSLKYFLPCIFLLTLSCVLIKQTKKSLPQNYDSLIIDVEKSPQARMLIDFDLKNNLSNSTADLFPNLQKAIKANGSPDIDYLSKTSELDDYYKIIALKDDWKELLEKNKINFAFLRRDSSLAGVLIEVEKWKIVQSTEPQKYIERGIEKFSPIVLVAK